MSGYTRRDVLKRSAALAGGLAPLIGRTPRAAAAQPGRTIRFGVVGLNHPHIYAQTETVRRGGGQLVSVYADEPDLAQAFVKRFPDVRVARSRREILEDTSLQLVVSAAIPVDRAPLGIDVMRHGKDFMSDKPGITTLTQLAEVRRVQAETKRIYSIMFNERFENAATIQASALVKAGAIGTPLQTVGLGRPGSLNAPNTAASSATLRLTSSISSCISPDRRRLRSSRRRSATSSIPNTQASRISAT